MGSTSRKLLLNDKFCLLDALILMMGDLNGDISVASLMKFRAPFYVNESSFFCVFAYIYPALIPQTLISFWWHDKIRFAD